MDNLPEFPDRVQCRRPKLPTLEQVISKGWSAPAEDLWPDGLDLDPGDPADWWPDQERRIGMERMAG